MGRIKTRKVKGVTQDLIENYRDQFSGDFNANKLKVNELTNVKSKKLRNIIAGYATRMAKSEQK